MRHLLPRVEQTPQVINANLQHNLELGKTVSYTIVLGSTRFLIMMSAQSGAYSDMDTPSINL